MNDEITVTLTVLEIMALRAMTCDSTSEEDFKAVERRYGTDVAIKVGEEDAGYEAYVKLGNALEKEGFDEYVQR